MKVIINAGGRAVEIDSGDQEVPLDDLRKAAREEWDHTGGVERVGPGVGFTSQIDGQYDHDRQQGSMWRPVRADVDLTTTEPTVPLVDMREVGRG